jgi:hypothetical protein
MRIPAAAKTLASDGPVSDADLVEAVGPLLRTLVANLRIFTNDYQADATRRPEALAVDPYDLLAVAEVCFDGFRRWAAQR